MERQDFASVQEALDFVAAHPSTDEVMSRRPPFPKKDIQFLCRHNRAVRVCWGNAQDQRAQKKEENEE